MGTVRKRKDKNSLSIVVRMDDPEIIKKLEGLVLVGLAKNLTELTNKIIEECIDIYLKQLIERLER